MDYFLKPLHCLFKFYIFFHKIRLLLYKLATCVKWRKQTLNTLADIIKNRILNSGRITFAEFMEMALYHPESGYYSSEKIKLGKTGDYYTSPLVHKVFGELLCKQIVEMWEISGGRDFTIVEMGAGDGTLCYDLMNYARKKYSDFYDRLRYIIIEESRGMRERQREKLLGNAEAPPPLTGGGQGEGELWEFPENKILWLDYSDPIFEIGITGCFISNELVDAFPVHLVEMSGGELNEVYVGIQNEPPMSSGLTKDNENPPLSLRGGMGGLFSDKAFTEILGTPSTSEINKYFERMGITLEEGQRAEVNLKAIDWMKWIAKSLNKGFVITVDYGYPAEELYAPYRKDGTLLCYFKHRVIEDPFINIGEQDITAHVDFTTLISSGEEDVLHTAGMTDQTHFLFGLGLGGAIQTSALEQRLMIKNLIMPGGMGSVFKVLIQYKGFDSKPELSGLKKDIFISS
ncbi:MAG: SAM-dependent methyltransferase [Nitrospirae bacterium]|nr:SAM-dependent methyltransferase [Nitrospirota bacterium]